jgi:hypothetical protein
MDNSAFGSILGPIITGLWVGAILLLVVVYMRSARKRLQYMETQIRLLMHIAAASGVSQDKIAEIVAEADLPEFQSKK